MNQSQTHTPNVPAPETASRPSELPSRMARLLGAWRARRATVTRSEPESQVDSKTGSTETNEFDEPPVEWALRLMM